MSEIMTQTPPTLQGPSDKERKYDRQLRLWAASGQAALESANLLLVNSGPGTVGVETLKNLVLPGIGKFTIADDTVVGDADLGVNFFLDESSRGQSRAKCCADFLLELNPEVQGEWFPKEQGSLDLSELLNSSDPPTAILYTLPLDKSNVELLEEFGRQQGVPVIAIHSVGFYSYFRISLPGTFPIVDTHPDETGTADLRLLLPWLELEDFAKDMTKDIDNLDSMKHGHLPLVVILLHYIEVWKQNHDGAPPTSYADKIEFRKAVTAAMRTDNAEGGEENFEEAASAVMKHVIMPTIPSTLREVFDYKHVDDSPKSSFWIITEAVKQFYDEHNQLPVSGGLPDMKAQSNVYIQLQNIYKEKARRDAAEVFAMVQSLPGGNSIEKKEVDLYCTNARFIKLINSDVSVIPTLEEAVARELANDEIAAIAGPEMPLSLLPIYLALKSTSHESSASATDIEKAVCSRAPALEGHERMKQIAQEVARAAGAELHNISAAVGGMVAQEIIKVVTKQYIPIDNTCIYDGLESKCQILRL